MSPAQALHRAGAAALALTWLMPPCTAWAQPAAYAEPAEPRLRQGRSVWLGTCRECHGNSMSDAPQARDAKAWQARLVRGRAALQATALAGKLDKDGAGMPPRGGNARLTDDEVRAAVDYMLWIVETSRKERP